VANEQAGGGNIAPLAEVSGEKWEKQKAEKKVPILG
jgi:hypothetical protein|tara:strand:- start:642 stop:749 length:108 start_codon:yes stop_codon:yes gene_type:complete